MEKGNEWNCFGRGVGRGDRDFEMGKGMRDVYFT